MADINAIMKLFAGIQQGQQALVNSVQKPRGIMRHNDDMTNMGTPGMSGTPGLDQWYRNNPGYQNTPVVADTGQAQRDHQLFLDQIARSTEEINAYDEHAKLAGLPTYKEKMAQDQQSNVKSIADEWNQTQSQWQGAQNPGGAGGLNFNLVNGPMDVFAQNSENALNWAKIQGQEMVGRGLKADTSGFGNYAPIASVTSPSRTPTTPSALPGSLASVGQDPFADIKIGGIPRQPNALTNAFNAPDKTNMAQGMESLLFGRAAMPQVTQQGIAAGMTREPTVSPALLMAAGMNPLAAQFYGALPPEMPLGNFMDQIMSKFNARNRERANSAADDAAIGRMIKILQTSK